MGGVGSKFETQQVLLVGLEKTGKTLFLKKMLESNKEKEETNIDNTIGYNYVDFCYESTNFNIWDLGGDQITKSFWPTFYRNLKYTSVIYFINVTDKSSHMSALKELLILLNQEELKDAKFFVIFNVFLGNQILDETLIKEYREKGESIMKTLGECPIHDYDTRVDWEVVDVKKSNLTKDLLNKCLVKAKK
jgi:GTPase SAR1 family protein